ncbi:MAG: hypothetical protein ACO1OB_10945 [Archangium sp.]
MACLFSLLTPRRDLGSAIDTMFSFTLVAGMIGGGHIPSMPSSELATWNVCVIINVLGAGVGRLRQSLGSSETERRA